MAESVLAKPVSSPQPEPLISPQPAMRIVVHWRWLIGLIAIVAVLSSVFFWRYKSQSSKLATAILDRAGQLEQENEWLPAAEYLFRYLQLQPDDEAVWMRLAETYRKGATTRNQKARAIEFHYRSLGFVKDQAKKDELNLRLAELLLETGQFSEAKEKASLLNENVEAQKIVAMATSADSVLAEPHVKQQAFEKLQSALEKNPGDVELATTAASLCRTGLISPTLREREAISNDIMQRMVSHESNKQNAMAWLASYAYRKMFSVGTYEDDLQMAIKIDPENFAVAVAAAQQSLESAQLQAPNENEEFAKRRTAALDEGETWYRKAIDLEPTKSLGYQGLGAVLLLQSESAEASSVYREALKKTTDDPLGLYDRLATALLADKKFADAEKAIADLRSATERFVIRSGVAVSQRDVMLQGARVDFLQAKLHFGRNQTAEVIQKLDSVLSTWQKIGLDTEPFSDKLELYVLLSGAYGRTGQWDQAALVAERAAAIAPRSAQIALSTAVTWKSAGNPEKAIEYYDRVISLEPKLIAPVSWIDIAEMQMAKQLTRAEADRDWKPFQDAVRQTGDEGSRSWRVRMLAANYAFATQGANGKDAAVKHLVEAEKIAPKDSALWYRLVFTYHNLGLAKDADRALGEFKSNHDQPLASEMLRLALLSLRGQHAEAVRQGEELLVKVPPDQRESALWEFAQLNRRAGNVDAVRKSLADLHKAHPDRASYLIELAEIDLRRRDTKSLEEWEKDLQRIEGDSGVRWRYYRAYRLLFGAKDAKDTVLPEVARLYGEIDTRRPAWAPGYALQGLLVLLEGNEQKATQSYQRAVELGYNDIATLRTLVMLLYRAQRFAEADSYLERWRRLAPTSNGLDALSISLAAQMDQLPEAVRRAREAIRQRPDDPEAQIWLGQMLESNNELAEAEKVLTLATEKHAKDARTWSALFSYQVRRNNRSGAELALTSLASKSDAEKSERAFIVAQGYELLGDTEKAEKLYRRAAELELKTVNAKVRLASMLARRDPAEAEKLLRESMKKDPTSAPARRLLAAILAGRGGAEAWQEVQQLLANEVSDPSDIRLKAVILALRGGPQNVNQAVELMRPLVNETNRPAANDRMLLASLFERQGKTQAAEEQHQNLIEETKSQPAQVVNYVEFLLRNGRPDDAEKQLPMIEQAVKAGTSRDRVQYIALKARCLKMQERSGEIQPLVQKFFDEIEPTLKDNNEKTVLFDLVAQIYESNEMFDKAIDWRQKLLAILPQSYLYLARDLSMAGRYREAIDLLRNAKDEDKKRPEFASQMVSVLVTGDTPAEAVSELEPLIAAVAAQFPDHGEVLYATATLRAIQGRNEEAIRLLEQANRVRPNNVPILNNLATLLGEMPGRHADALRYIENAIEIAGEQPPLLDTKATILTRTGKSQEAIELLEQTVSMPFPDPRYLLHLAGAYHQDGSQRDAESRLRQAIQAKVESQILTTADKSMLEDLRLAYETSTPDS